MPIKNLSNVRQMPRLGKIRTGVKVPNKSGQGEHPEAVDYFCLPPEISAAFGEKPKSLPIMFPVEDETKFASQYYKCYSSFRGLVCKGDGETCSRLIDTKTGDFAHRDTTDTDRRDLPCNGRECPMYVQKKCKEIMNLQFLLPEVPGLGVWQLDTGSYHSIVNVNSAVDLIRSMCGRIAMIPLKLTIEPREVTIKGEKGQVKKTVNVLQIRTDATLAEIQRLGAMPASQVMLPPPDEEKPDLLYPELEEIEAAAPVAEKAPAITDKEIDELWGKDKKQPPQVIVKPAEKPPVAQPAEQAAPVVSNVKGKRDPATILTLGGLFTACYEDFNMSRTDVAKEAGFSNPDQLKGTTVKKLQETYTAIAAVRGS